MSVKHSFSYLLEATVWSDMFMKCEYMLSLTFISAMRFVKVVDPLIHNM